MGRSQFAPTNLTDGDTGIQGDMTIEQGARDVSLAASIAATKLDVTATTTAD